MGRVFTRGTVQKSSRHDRLVTAVDPDLPLLHLQHECATRGATAAPIEAPPRFLVAYGQITNGQRSRALIQVVLHKGFGSLRRPVANLLEGAILDWRAGEPERGTTGTFNRQQQIHTVGILQ